MKLQYCNNICYKDKFNFTQLYGPGACNSTHQPSSSDNFSIKPPTESGNWLELINNLPNCDLCGRVAMGISVTDWIDWASSLEIISLSTRSHISPLLTPYGRAIPAIPSQGKDPPISLVLYLKINIDSIFFLHCLKFSKMFVFHLDRRKYRTVSVSLKPRRHSGNYVVLALPEESYLSRSLTANKINFKTFLRDTLYQECPLACLFKELSPDNEVTASYITIHTTHTLCDLAEDLLSEELTPLSKHVLHHGTDLWSCHALSSCSYSWKAEIPDKPLSYDFCARYIE